ncbi:PAS domain S-box-containing protein [Nocardioides cavernae]|uniref:histidine kinase n=1 Tax=Nocardioides cavernae TaxID=1921566 RepID=A0A7Y9H3N1_9ACTN|nr:ATP-binding protein [Nocardioides cavernae]NYE37356.1 PAS domain S-box-containing protein [Nocardioides cavernae]
METSPQEWVCDETLAESRQRYASLFTYHPHAAYSLDPRGFYTDANPRALEMTGLTLDELRHAHFAQVVHPADLPLVEDGFERAMAGLPQVVEARVVRTDDTIVHFRTTMIPVVVDEVIVGVHGVAEDVTHARQVLEELEDANAAKTRFLATVSHELRTPLAALVGATELLRESDLQDDSRHYVDMLHRSGTRLAELVHDMLEFSCLEARRTTLRPRPFEVRALVDDIAEWAAPLARCRGISFTVSVDASVPRTTLGDGMRVSQVVTNLVRNAVEYTERGGISLVVSARGLGGGDAEIGSGTWAEFTVIDTGVGIGPEQQGSLFEPFAQAGPCSGGRVGAGLGLAISRDLADLMGGRLEVWSEPGTGSTFTLGVPLEVAADA